MNLMFSNKSNNLNNKSIFFDTNCYRCLARDIISAGESTLNSQIKFLCKCEEKFNIKIQISYTVLLELIIHLGDEIDSITYRECKLALSIAIEHAKNDRNALLYSFDTEVLNFIYGKINLEETENEKSLFDFIIKLKEHGFKDLFVKSKMPAFWQAMHSIKSIKDSWKDSFKEYILANNDNDFIKWQIHPNDERLRKKILDQNRNGYKTGEIFDSFAIGLENYAAKIINNKLAPVVNYLEIKQRFLPVFKLQYRIVEHMCQSGYNLDENDNDILDFIILCNLNPLSEMLFVSNETSKLLPYLEKLGYKNSFISFNNYKTEINFK